MVTCKCISKLRDKNERITGYFLDDGVNRKMVKPAELKEAIASKKLNCINLQIDKLGRLIDKTENSTDLKNEIAVNKKIDYINLKNDDFDSLVDKHIDKNIADQLKIRYIDKYVEYILKMRHSVNKEKVIQLDTNVRKLAAVCIKEYNECLNSILNTLAKGETVIFYDKIYANTLDGLTEEEMEKHEELFMGDSNGDSAFEIISEDKYINCIDKKKIEALLDKLEKLDQDTLKILDISTKNIYENMLYDIKVKTKNSRYTVFSLEFGIKNIKHDRLVIDYNYNLGVISDIYDGISIVISIDKNKLCIDKKHLASIKNDADEYYGYEDVESFINDTCDVTIFNSDSDEKIGKMVVDNNGAHVELTK